MAYLMHDEDALAEAMKKDAENVPTFGQVLMRPEVRKAKSNPDLRGDIQELLKRNGGLMTALEIADELCISPDAARQCIRCSPEGIFEKIKTKKVGRGPCTFYRAIND